MLDWANRILWKLEVGGEREREMAGHACINYNASRQTEAVKILLRTPER